MDYTIEWQPDCKKKQKIVIMKQMEGTMKKFIVSVQKAASRPTSQNRVA